MQSEVRGNGPEPINAIFCGGTVGESEKAERVAHSIRERSM